MLSQGDRRVNHFFTVGRPGEIGVRPTLLGNEALGSATLRRDDVDCVHTVLRIVGEHDLRAIRRPAYISGVKGRLGQLQEVSSSAPSGERLRQMASS